MYLANLDRAAATVTICRGLGRGRRNLLSSHVTTGLLELDNFPGPGPAMAVDLPGCRRAGGPADWA